MRSWRRSSTLATTSSGTTAPTVADVEVARGRLAGHARVTPVYGSETLSRRVGTGFDEAMAEATRRVDELGATFVHAFEDAAVIAGQGTIGLELAEQLPDVDTFLIPVGGGGVAAGISIALRARRPGVRLIG